MLKLEVLRCLTRAGDFDKSKSTSSPMYIFSLGEGPIDWKSMLKNNIVL